MIVYVICKTSVTENEVLESILFPHSSDGPILDGAFFKTQEEAEFTLNETGLVRKQSLKEQGYRIKKAEFKFI